jgi:hypothetical protein
MTTATAAPEYFITKCSQGHVARWTESERVAAVEISWHGHFGSTRCHCGAASVFKAIKVTITETECGPKCMTAQGPRCDCSCGGHNHSKGYSA